MKTITKVTNVFSYSELSPSSQEKARDWYREGMEFFWFDEYMKTMKKFADHFGVKLGRWELDYQDTYRCQIPFDCPELETSYESDDDENGTTETVGEFLRRHANPAFLSGNCPFTGFCTDEDILDGIRANIDNPSQEQSDLTEVFDDCFHRFVKSMVADWEGQNEDEPVAQTIDDDEYEFTEDGKRFLG